MDERYIAAVDLGTSKIAVTVARINNKDVQVIYYKETPSEGIRNSYVFNPKKASDPLKHAIADAESELKIKILQVVVGLPRYSIKQESACASLERSDKESSITQEEIDFLKNNAIDSYPLADSDKEVMYGVVAQSFSTDDYLQAIESDIVGMVSDTLDGNFKVFVGAKRASANIDMVANNVGVAIARKYFIPEMTAKAVLTHEEMENGVALIEIGAGTTSVTVYHSNIMRFYASIPFGGRTITNDIRIECGTSERLAENIKLAYGICMPEKLLSLRDKIIQINNEEAGTSKQLSVKYLSEVITCRIKEIMDAMLYKIQESGFADSLRNGIVLTGGTAALPNLSGYVKEISGYNVRIGYPLHKFSSSGCSEINVTSATASVGMVLAAKENEYLNCLDDAVVTARKAEEEEEEPETVDTVMETEAGGDEGAHEEPQPRDDGRLMDPEEFGPAQPKQKKEKEKKPKKEKKKHTVTWKPLERVAKLFNDTIDSFYDDMQ